MPANIPYDRAAEGPMLNVQQVRDVLGCGKAHVYRLISDGKLKAFRVGKVKGLRVTKKSLDRYLAKNKVVQS